MADGPGIVLALCKSTNQHKRRTRCFIDLYEAWEASEPGQGYAAKAAEWRAKVPEKNGE